MNMRKRRLRRIAAYNDSAVIMSGDYGISRGLADTLGRAQVLKWLDDLKREVNRRKHESP